MGLALRPLLREETMNKAMLGMMKSMREGEMLLREVDLDIMRIPVGGLEFLGSLYSIESLLLYFFCSLIPSPTSLYLSVPPHRLVFTASEFLLFFLLLVYSRSRCCRSTYNDLTTINYIHKMRDQSLSSSLP
jgi:hypothetical protein